LGGENSSLSRFFAGICTNPLTWRNDSSFIDGRYNLGSVNHKFQIDKNEVGTQIRSGVLCISPPKDKGYKTFGTGYHIYDYSFFYMNIRKNVEQRVEAYLKSH
jgi:hypothetical protein